MSKWLLDEDRAWYLRRGGAVVWIAPRPVYCDRGHYIAHVEGIASIDAADCFPRYYMSLERGKEELEEWLDWRLQREKAQ